MSENDDWMSGIYGTKVDLGWMKKWMREIFGYVWIGKWI